MPLGKTLIHSFISDDDDDDDDDDLFGVGGGTVWLGVFGSVADKQTNIILTSFHIQFSPHTICHYHA